MKVPGWLYVYGGAVFALWLAAEATGLSNDWLTGTACAAVLPVFPAVEALLLVVFTILRFDPTVAAPAWQHAVTTVTVPAAMAAAAMGQVVVARTTVTWFRDRQEPRFVQLPKGPTRCR